MTTSLAAKWAVFLGMALIAAFAAYTLYTDVTASNFSTRDLFGALAMVGLLFILAGTVLRQLRS